VIPGTPAAVRALPAVSVVYVVVFAIAAAAVIAGSPERLPPTVAANLLLVVLYSMIGWYLFRTQLENRRASGSWSLSGLALTLVFPTCALMHGAWIVHQVTGRYQTDVHTVVIDWLAVPAAVYFLWVVRGLHVGTLRDWNGATTGVVTGAALT
jgi:surface polysaccharide O-acyltransferase-like enzyme